MIIDNTSVQVKLIEETFLLFIYQLVMASAGMRVVSCLVTGKKRKNELTSCQRGWSWLLLCLQLGYDLLPVEV